MKYVLLCITIIIAIVLAEQITQSIENYKNRELLKLERERLELNIELLRRQTKQL
jgi:hypothetical protein